MGGVSGIVNRTRKTRTGTPTYQTLIVRMEVPQVDGRLIDYLMETTAEGNRDIKRYPKNPTWQRSASLARESSRCLPNPQAGLQVFNCKKEKKQNSLLIIMIKNFLKKFLEREALEQNERRR